VKKIFVFINLLFFTTFINSNPLVSFLEGLRHFHMASTYEQWNILDLATKSCDDAIVQIRSTMRQLKEGQEIEIEESYEWFDICKNAFDSELVQTMNNHEFTQQICQDILARTIHLRDFLPAKRTRTRGVDEGIGKIINWGPLKILPQRIKNIISPKQIHRGFAIKSAQESLELNLEILVTEIYVDKETDLPHQTMQQLRPRISQETQTQKALE
jgi:hypothetical protein